MSLCPLMSVWWTLSKLWGGSSISWQSSNWSMNLLVWCHTTPGKHNTKHSIFGNPCMHFLLEMTQNLCKASKGIEKLIYVGNFKNNEIEVLINK